MKHNYRKDIIRRAYDAKISDNYTPISNEEGRDRALADISAMPPQELLDKNGNPRKPNKQSEGLSYEEWEKRLDAVISGRFGLGMSDFPDWNSMDAYEDDLSVAEGFAAFKEEQDDLDGLE